MSRLPSVSLILLAWNRAALTARALDSLLASDIGDSEVIVVDNGSTDATPQMLARHAPRVRVLRLAQNLGFVRGNNAGIAAAAAGNDVVLLNNDLLFNQADWLLRLRECAYGHAGCGIAGVRLVDAQGRLLHAGTRVLPDDGAGVQTASGRVEIDVGQYTDADHIVEGVVFAAVYIKREVIAAVGALHEDYVTYAEDSDYCLRARAAGWHTRLCGGVTLRHDQHGSTGDDAAWRARLLAEGRATFARHWGETLRAQYEREITVAGALDFPRHVADNLRPFLRALDAAGIRLRYRSLYAAVLPEAIAEPGDSHDHLLNTVRRRGTEACPAMALCVGDLALWPRVQAGYRIGYAEFEHLAPGDLDILRSMDEIWTPTIWHARQLFEAGLVIDGGIGFPEFWTPTEIRTPAIPHAFDASGTESWTPTISPGLGLSGEIWTPTEIRALESGASTRKVGVPDLVDLMGVQISREQASGEVAAWPDSGCPDSRFDTPGSGGMMGVQNSPGSGGMMGVQNPSPPDSAEALTGPIPRIRPLPWGVDPPYAHPDLRASRATTGERIVLCLARWDELDQPGRLLETWTHTFRRDEAVRLLLCIDALDTDLAAVTRSLALDVHGGRYSLLLRPRLAEEQRNALFAAADVVLSNSRSRRRGLALLQALACGRPVIAPDGSAAQEWLRRYGGWIVPAAADQPPEAALLACLRAVLQDFPAARQRALEGSRRLREHGNWSSSAALARDYLRRPLPAAPRPPPARSGHGLIVLGMHRSGTSCVAGLLQLLGAYAGEPGSFLRDPAENPRGFVERGDLHLACAAALRRRGGDWSVPLGWDEQAVPAAREQWRADWQSIQAQLAAQPPWLVKEPRLCLLLDEILDLIAQPLLIHVVREPTAAAASLMHRHGLTAPHALALWAHYNLAAAALRRDRPGIVLDYHSLLAQPRLVLRRLLDFLQGQGVRGLREPDAEELAAWIGPQLARQRHAREPPPNPAQQALWQALRLQADGATAALPAADGGDMALLYRIAREHQAVAALEKGAK
jgi:GT2 family glycosyltransferase